MVNWDRGTGLSLGVSRPLGDSLTGFSVHLEGIFLGVESLSNSFIRSETGVLRLEMRDILRLLLDVQSLIKMTALILSSTLKCERISGGDLDKGSLVCFCWRQLLWTLLLIHFFSLLNM